jgi:hypothetical protein
MASTFKEICKQFDINPNDPDADERLLKALHAADGNKRKRGREREWTGERQVEFMLDEGDAYLEFIKTHPGREPKKKELAPILKRLFPTKYGDYSNDRLRTMLSDAHLRDADLRPLWKNKEAMEKFLSEMPDISLLRCERIERKIQDEKLPDREKRRLSAIIYFVRSISKFKDLMGWDDRQHRVFLEKAIEAVRPGESLDEPP